MRDVEAAIKAKVDSIAANNTLFAFLNDESIDVTERLTRVAPCFSYVALGFYDLQLLVLRYPAAEAKLDRIKKAINAHCIEDSTHWPWFLDDLRTFGLDRERTFSSTIKYLWGESTRTQRSACYQLAILADKASEPILRFAMLLTMEIIGHSLFTKFLAMADKSEQETGKEWLYFGRTHFERESGGLHGEEEIENELLAMDLEPEMKTKALEIAMKSLEIQDVELDGVGIAAYKNKKW